ncbi:MAG: hypothetical protein Q8R88_09240 [Desulfoprunum sp.]|nr:hypothetical protein [Desulfoprunum sp.]
MGVETQQLADIFHEVSEVFAQHPSITVTPIKGDPPEQYEVHYNIIGVYKDDAGKIQHSADHTITITIPFGFPHFPPSCKPKTSLFHPDFDPAAICLGDFWEHERSLPELIYYIGKMITGEIYSKENTFNEEAAAWYRDNASRLPFAELPSLDSIKKQDITTPTSSSLVEEIEVDTLDDSDFSSTFDYLGIEREAQQDQSAQEPFPIPAQTASEDPDDIDVENIWLLSRQKRFYQLKGILKDLQSGTGSWFFEGKDELSERITTVLAEARKIYIQGDSLEHQGLPGKALEKYIAVEEMVSDYPKIHDDIRRAEQSMDLLGDWVQGNSTKSSGPPKGPAKEKKVQPEKTEKTSQLTFYTEKSKRHFNIVPLVILGCGLFIAGPLVYFYSSLTSQYEQAEQLLTQCSNQLQAKKFEAASKSCDSALSLSKGIIFLKNQARISLNEKIESILNSEELRQGLAGFVLLDGKYVLKTTADSLKNSKNIVAQGDKLMSQSNWQKAIEIYTEGLNSVQKETKMDAPYRMELEKKIHLAKTRMLMQTATQEMAQKAWKQARQNFELAMTEMKTLDADIQQKLSSEIRPQLDKCSFLLLKQQGDKLFASSDWTGAFSHFQEAIALGSNLEQSETQVLTSLQGDIIRAELYATINEGKAAFENHQWDEAIKKYAKASKILMDNQGLLKQSDLDQNRQKLARIMLQASIIRDRQEADRNIEKENWSEAEKRLELVIETISKSPVGKEKEFQTTLTESGKTIAELKEKQFIADKVKYLEDNFQTLFSENYPAATPDTLTTPVITYIKRIEDKLLFKLQCTETGRGRPFTLVMFYTYSELTKKWAFHSNTE